MRRFLHRAAGAGALLAAALLLASSQLVGNTFGLFNAETKNNASAFAGGWVDPPSSLAASASGYDVNLTWTPGTHGPVTGQKLYGVDNGTNSNCTGAAYTLISTLASASTASAADASRGTLANDGNWFCYRVASTSATVWTAQLSTAVQLGLVATGLSTVNASTRCSGASTPATGTIDCNDQIIITFNQRVAAPTSPIAVCTWAGAGTSGSIVLGDTAATKCTAAGDTYSIGRLTGMAIGTSVKYTSSTVAVSTSAPWTMTITLGGVKTTSTESGTFTFTGSNSTLSFATTHQAALCATTATTCRPSAALAF
jgi:hypothetical protein